MIHLGSGKEEGKCECRDLCRLNCKNIHLPNETIPGKKKKGFLWIKIFLSSLESEALVFSLDMFFSSSSHDVLQPLQE